MRYLKHLFPLCVLIGGVYGCSKSRIPEPALIPTTKTYAYVGDYNNLFICNVNPQTGQFEGCQDPGFAEFLVGQGITSDYSPIASVATVGSKTYAYIISYDNSSPNIYQCLIDPTTGLFAGCGPSGGVGVNPTAISANTAQNGNTYIYVRDQSSNAVLQCSINATTGNLSCNSIFSNPALGDAPSIVFNTVGTNEYVYLPNDDQTIYRCNVNFDGTFSNCENQTITGLSEAYGIGFASVGNQVSAYVADYNQNNIFQCAVSAIDGSLSNCTASFGVYEAYFAVSLLLGGQSFVYTSSYADDTNNIIKCTVNSSTANLENCTDSGVGVLFYGDDDNLSLTFANVTY